MAGFPREEGDIMSKTDYNPEIKKAIDTIVLKNPVVTPGKMFSYPAYYINKKLFACIYKDGVGVKVPATVAHELIGQKGIVHFQPLGRPKTKEWIQINRDNLEDYLNNKKDITNSFLENFQRNNNIELRDFIAYRKKILNSMF